MKKFQKFQRYYSKIHSLVLIEHNHQKIIGSTYHTITAAKKIGGKVTGLVAGKECNKIAEIVSKIDGIDQVIYYNGLEDMIVERLEQVVLKEQKEGEYSHIISNHNSFGKNIIPRLGGYFDIQPITDIIDILSPKQFKRSIYAGNAITEIESKDLIQLLTIRSTSFEKSEMKEKQVEIKKKEIEFKNIEIEFKGESLSKSERPELTSAKIVISGGRALKTEENFNLLYELADKLHAAVGASRAAVDMGIAPNEIQVGQTGKIVAPDLYIAFGISGAIQHLSGMKDSKCIVCVNKDKEAPIFQVSDYGLVEDLFKVIPEMNQLI